MVKSTFLIVYFAQMFAGTGFVIEPYQGSQSKTLVSYLGNVRMT